MVENLGIINVQNVPGDTDFDNNAAAEIVSSSEPDERQSTGDKQPRVAPPIKQTLIGEPTAAPRAFKAAAWTRYERRIF